MTLGRITELEYLFLLALSIIVIIVCECYIGSLLSNSSLEFLFRPIVYFYIRSNLTMIKQSHIEAIQEEFKEIEQNKAWIQVYEKVRTEGAYDLSCTAALKPQNKCLNRYKDVLPYDHSRIILQECNTDYINASLVEVESINRKYVLCQGPLPQTTPHFWLLIWQEKTKAIIMLNKIMEKNQIKCHQYWPIGEKRGGKSVSDYTSVDLKIELLKEVSHSHYIYRTFRLSNTTTGENREILHFHYTTWSDFGVPQSPDAFFNFLSVVRASQCLDSQYGPAVIHCSAGIGRSGTFCLADSILLMLDKGLCSAKAGKVLEVLLDMRRYRMGLIQTPDQLRFSYQAIIYGAQRLNETNGKDPSEESSSEDVSVEEAPPQPPPRTDSLTRSMLEAELLVNSVKEDDPTVAPSSSSSSDDDDDDDTDGEIPPLVEDDHPTAKSSPTALQDLNTALGRPLPQEPLESAINPDVTSYTPSESKKNASVCISSSNNTPVLCGPYSSDPPSLPPSDPTSDVRRRLRQARVEATSAKVATIKEKSREAERWHERKRLLTMPLSVCAAAILVIGIGGGILYYCNKQLQS